MYSTARTAFAALGAGVTIRFGGRVRNGVGQTSPTVRMEEIGGQIRPVTTRRARFLASDFGNAAPAVGDMIDVVAGGIATACEIVFTEYGESGATVVLEWKVSP
jgi:hypothetical protein